MSPVNREGPLPARTVVVHDRLEPPLTAGDYEVRVSQTVSGDPDLGQVPDDVRHLRVTAPRYLLPSTEILSTFPPANADGPFSTRLAQVALKRRTLPWERAGGPTRPWLALVLLCDGEGNFLPSVPVEQAVTAGVRLPGANPDGPTCAAIEVPSRVVRQVFPSRQDLPFTCHVRQVPLDDTELAQGDDDGWVAVVFSARLPRPGMRYRACLISLEGQWNELPDNPPSGPGITKTVVYDRVDATTIEAARQPRSDGVGLNVAPTSIASSGSRRATARTHVDRERVDNAVPPASTGHSAPDAWSLRAAERSGAAAGSGALQLTATPASTAVGVGLGSVILDVNYDVLDPGARLLRFPVLASWEFRCEGDKDFAVLVQELDVGLLGTADRPGRGPTDRVPEVAETGHLVVAGNDRSGEATSSWYRGPFVPRAVKRRDALAVHVADQLRRLAEDGRVEIGEAAAFDLGRLLALSSPSTVGALREWRRRGFTARRAGAVGGASVLGGLLAEWSLVVDGALTVDRFATALGHTLLTAVGGRNVVESILPARPRVDPLPDLKILRDPAATIAAGFDVPLDDLRVSLDGGVRPVVTAQLLAPMAEVGFTALARQPELLAPLAQGLGARVGELRTQVERFSGPAGPAGPGGPEGAEGAEEVPESPRDEGAARPRAKKRQRETRKPAASWPEMTQPDTVEGLFPDAAPMPEEQQ